MSDRTYRGWTDVRLQQQIRRFIDASGHRGLTVKELRSLIPDTEAHHGWISGATSLLHGENKIARLRGEKRDGYKVYVELDFIDNRPCEAQGWGGRLSKEERAWVDSLTEILEYWMEIDSAGARFATDKTRAERHQHLFFRALKAVWGDRP